MPFAHLFTPGAFAAFVQVVMIDLALAGDNAVAVGMAAAGLPERQRKRAIVLGLAGAVVMLVSFALITTQLLRVVGLLVAGGFLLLWVCWKMWRELREQAQERQAEAALEEATGIDVNADKVADSPTAGARPKKLRDAFLQILIADVSMSLDNVLAVAGAARQHPWVLVGGLMLSITLTGLAASWIAKLLHRFKWIGFVGLAIVFYVACHMIWEGVRTVAIDLGQTHVYNRAMPGPLDIRPPEIAKHRDRSPH
jgi:YjbE family integral membrane protein